MPEHVAAMKSLASSDHMSNFKLKGDSEHGKDSVRHDKTAQSGFHELQANSVRHAAGMSLTVILGPKKINRLAR